MTTIGETKWRSILSPPRSQGSGGDTLNVDGVAQRPVLFNGYHGDASTAVIGGEYPFSRGIDTGVSRPPALRVDYVEQLQVTVRLNSECGDRTVSCAAIIRDFVH